MTALPIQNLFWLEIIEHGATITPFPVNLSTLLSIFGLGQSSAGFGSDYFTLFCIYTNMFLVVLHAVVFVFSFHLITGSAAT